MDHEARIKAPFCAFLSVVIPCYAVNAESLRTCLAAFAKLDPWPEIILVDDGSPEPLKGRLAFPPGLPEPVQLRHDQNLGPFEARRTGLLCASRPHIHFVDSDDLVDIRLYSTLTKHLPLADIVTFRALTRAPDGSETSRGQPETDHRLDQRADRAESFFRFRYLFALWNKIFSRTLALRVYSSIPSPLDIRYGEDFLFNALAFWFANGHEHRETVGYRYCQHPKQATAASAEAAMKPRLIADQTTAMLTVQNFLEQQPPGHDRDCALQAFHERQFHATMRLFRSTLGAGTADDMDEIKGLLDGRLTMFAPWAREILRQQERVDHFRERLRELQNKG